MPGFVVGVDFGTATVVAVLRRPDGTVRPLLFDGSPLLPSAVFVEPGGGAMVVGRDALRRARVDPAGYVADALSHLDVGAVSVQQRLVPVAEIIGAGFARLGHEAVRSAGGTLPRLVVAHPAHWDERRQEVLIEAGGRAGLGVPTLVAAPIAAAAHWAARRPGGLQIGRCVLVYDLGEAGCEISLVRATVAGLRVIASTVAVDTAGRNLDGIVADAIGPRVAGTAADEWARLSAPVSPADHRHRLEFLDALRQAKEALSREAAVSFHLPLIEDAVSITRAEFELAAQAQIARTADDAARLLWAAGVDAHELADIILVGGSTRIPLVGEVLADTLGIQPTLSDEPQLATAEGAISAVAGVPPAIAQITATPPLDAAPLLNATSPARRSRHMRLAAAFAAGLAVLLVLAVLQLTRGADTAQGAVPPSGTSSAQVGAGPSLADGPTAPATAGPAPRGGPSSQTASTPAAPVTPVASGTALPPPVTITVTAIPEAGRCTTDFEFSAQFTIAERGRYRWHWEFGGPNGYAYTGGGHDRDKDGIEKITRKFNTAGQYWAHVRVTSPVSLTSTTATVEVACP